MSWSKGILSQSSQKLYGGYANASEKAVFKNTRCRQERNADVVVVFPSISGSGNYAAVVVLDTAASNGGCCKMALLFMDTSADGTPIYGYQCNFRSQNPAKSFIEQNQIQGQKSCDAISLCEWKLDLMAKRVFEYLWGDQKEAVLRACQMIESCLFAAAAQSEAKQNELREKIQKLEQRILNLGEMRADGELTKGQYQELYSKATGELTSLKNQSEAKPQLDSEPQFDLSAIKKGLAQSAIKKGLAQLVDVSTAKISDELIEEFVEAVVPIKSYTFRWKMNLGNTSAVFEPANLLAPHILPVCSFTIDFENARQYRIANNLPLQFRRRDWHDLVVEVFV